MNIGILKEPDFENRVALLPESAKVLIGLKANVIVEQGAGDSAFSNDIAYTEIGATIADRSRLLSEADVIIGIHPPTDAEIANLKNEQVLLAVLQPLGNKALIDKLNNQKLTTFSLDNIPRTTRAQAMDVLSSMATAAGYKAVLAAASHSPRFFPMFMTAAGSITPSKVLILGAGVAGLQAIATARRLGAVVEAFDVRAAAEEEVKSLGAKFVKVEGAKDDTSAGGYAVEQSEEFLRKQKALIQEHASKADVIIATAQIPGRSAPLLVTKETIAAMRPGSVIVDLAAISGGNCELTENDKVTVHHGVTIIGNSNLASSIPSDASKMFGKNVVNFMKLIIDEEGNLNLNFEDDIVQGTCVTHNGEVVSERIQKSIAQTVA